MVSKDLGSKVERTVAMPSLPAVGIEVSDDLIAFYLSILPDLCPPGEDPDTYGETVYVDADLLELLHERINVGRYVAQAKLEGDPSLRTAVDLAEKLTDPDREAALLRSACAAAKRYQADPVLVERVFGWIMKETVVVEVAFVQALRS
jgi:chorismate mutase